MEQRKKLTSESGAPIPDDQNSHTAGLGGPIVLYDHHLIEKIARLNRERIPERVVHAVGSGAYGEFVATNAEAAEWTRMAAFSEIGKRTRIFVRFSTVAGSKGAPDCVRDLRGFAVRFYTEEGNWDLCGNSAPIFFIRDPLKFPDLVHSQKGHPWSNCQEATSVWDFFCHSPEATHQMTWLFGDRGIPRTLRHMNGYGVHTFQWVNDQGIRCGVKFHFKTNQGISNFSEDEALAIAGNDPQHHQRDLYKAIERGDFPTWTLYVQLMPEADARTYYINPFDATKVWPHSDYPLIEVGQMKLTETPNNYFSEVEQAALDPGHMVPGIGPSPDKLLQARMFAYADAQRYRLGINHTRLAVNSPKGCAQNAPRNYGRDGLMCTGDNGGRSVNYEPNSFSGPVQTNDPHYKGMAGRGLSGTHETEIRRVDDYTQAGRLFRLMSADEQARLLDRLSASLAKVRRDDVGERIVEKSIGHFRLADENYGMMLKDAIKPKRRAR